MGKGFLFDIRIEDSFKQEDGAISIQNGVFDVPLAALSKTAICMFWYLATKRAGDRFCVSKPDFMEKFPATSERQYYSAMQELIDVGYMKRDEETGFYNFNPNAEIEPIKKKEKKKDTAHNYSNIFIGINDIPLEKNNFINQYGWYILPVNGIKRGDEKTVYFCKCQGKYIPMCIGIILTNLGIPTDGSIWSRGNHMLKNRECAYVTIVNRALLAEIIDKEEIFSKLPDLTSINEDEMTRDEIVAWEGARIEALPKLCEIFEKNGIHNLGVIEMEQE